MGANLRQTAKAATLSAGVPPGAPPWVTANLIRDTIETWQPYYAGGLTEQEAVEILHTVGNFLAHGNGQSNGEAKTVSENNSSSVCVCSRLAE